MASQPCVQENISAPSSLDTGNHSGMKNVAPMLPYETQLSILRNLYPSVLKLQEEINQKVHDFVAQHENIDLVVCDISVKKMTQEERQIKRFDNLFAYGTAFKEKKDYVFIYPFFFDKDRGGGTLPYATGLPPDEHIQ